MTNPYRALIQRLADELQEYINYAPTGPCDQEQELVDEARALLAEPPSLKAEALAIVTRGNQVLASEEQKLLRRALEALDD